MEPELPAVAVSPAIAPPWALREKAIKAQLSSEPFKEHSTQSASATESASLHIPTASQSQQAVPKAAATASPSNVKVDAANSHHHAALKTPQSNWRAWRVQNGLTARASRVERMACLTSDAPTDDETASPLVTSSDSEVHSLTGHVPRLVSKWADINEEDLPMKSDGKERALTPPSQALEGMQVATSSAVQAVGDVQSSQSTKIDLLPTASTLQSWDLPPSSITTKISQQVKSTGAQANAPKVTNCQSAVEADPQEELKPVGTFPQPRPRPPPVPYVDPSLITGAHTSSLNRTTESIRPDPASIWFSPSLKDRAPSGGTSFSATLRAERNVSDAHRKPPAMEGLPLKSPTSSCAPISGQMSAQGAKQATIGLASKIRAPSPGKPVLHPSGLLPVSAVSQVWDLPTSSTHNTSTPNQQDLKGQEGLTILPNAQASSRALNTVQQPSTSSSSTGDGLAEQSKRTATWVYETAVVSATADTGDEAPMQTHSPTWPPPETPLQAQAAAAGKSKRSRQQSGTIDHPAATQAGVSTARELAKSSISPAAPQRPENKKQRVEISPGVSADPGYISNDVLIRLRDNLAMQVLAMRQAEQNKAAATPAAPTVIPQPASTVVAQQVLPQQAIVPTQVAVPPPTVAPPPAVQPQQHVPLQQPAQPQQSVPPQQSAQPQQPVPARQSAQPQKSDAQKAAVVRRQASRRVVSKEIATQTEPQVAHSVVQSASVAPTVVSRPPVEVHPAHLVRPPQQFTRLHQAGCPKASAPGQPTPQGRLTSQSHSSLAPPGWTPFGSPVTTVRPQPIGAHMSALSNPGQGPGTTPRLKETSSSDARSSTAPPVARPRFSNRTQQTTATQGSVRPRSRLKSAVIVQSMANKKHLPHVCGAAAHQHCAEQPPWLPSQTPNRTSRASGDAASSASHCAVIGNVTMSSPTQLQAPSASSPSTPAPEQWPARILHDQPHVRASPTAHFVPAPPGHPMPFSQPLVPSPVPGFVPAMIPVPLVTEAVNEVQATLRQSSASQKGTNTADQATSPAQTRRAPWSAHSQGRAASSGSQGWVVAVPVRMDDDGRLVGDGIPHLWQPMTPPVPFAPPIPAFHQGAGPWLPPINPQQHIRPLMHRPMTMHPPWAPMAPAHPFVAAPMPTPPGLGGNTADQTVAPTSAPTLPSFGSFESGLTLTTADATVGRNQGEA
ncbi:unnamed protein product [Jaminaea pallidilutea]